MKTRLRLLIAAAAGFVLSIAAPARSAEDFYKGKTIRFVVGLAPGGGYDLSARTVGRHIGKHIPGNPTVVVENMTGAGSLIAANYTYNSAKPDGLIHRREPDPEVKDLPRIPEIIKGEDNLSAYNTWVGTFEFQRPFMVPPGTPKERLQVLRKAFADTMKDPEFIAEAKKSKLQITYVTGEEVDKYVDKVLAVTPKAKELLSFLITKSKK